MALRVICRAIVLDQETTRILLVRNHNASFWYPPGGGWKEDCESVLQCIARELEEETSVQAYPVRLLYVQEFHPEDGNVHLELFWLALLTSTADIKEVHDEHGLVDESRWFAQAELQDLTVFPKQLKSKFWYDLAVAFTSPDPFLKEGE